MVEENPDIAVIILDVNMPKLNGLEVLEELKKRGLIESLVVLMLTTEVEPTLIRQAKDTGAMGWIVKPVRDGDLLATVKKVTSK